MTKIIKYIFKVLAIAILVLLLVILLVSLLIQTRPVKNQLTRIAENQASEFIDGDLKIGRLDGNFFAQLLLNDILLTTDEDTVAYISELDLRYNLLSLFNGTLDFHSIKIDQPYLYLQQVNDSTWNLQQLVEPGEEPTDTTSSGSININLNSFVLNEGKIKIKSPDTIIPQQINNLNADLSLVYSEDNIAANIRTINLRTNNPDLHLAQLSLNFKMNDSNAELSQFIIQTSNNKIEGHANYSTTPERSGEAFFITDPIHLNEFAFLIPTLTTAANPILALEGSLTNDSVNVALDLSDKNQALEATINSGNLFEYLFVDTTAILRYHLESKVTNINPGYWIGNPELNYLINGNINVRGKDIDPEKAQIYLLVNLFETTIEDQNFSNITADVALQSGDLTGTIQGEGGFGDFYVAPDINDLNGNPSYRLRFNANNLNLAVLTGTDSLASNINLQSTIKGTSFDPKLINAEGELIISKSSFQEFYLDSMVAQAKYASENLQVDTLWLQAGTLKARAAGNYSLNAESDLRVAVNFDDLNALKSFIPAVNIMTSGALEANVTGVPDSLEFTAHLQLDSTSYDTITFGGLELKANGNLTATDTLFSASANLKNLDLGSFFLDTIFAQVEGSVDSVFLQTRILNQDMDTELHAGIVPTDKIAITIPVWNIQYKNQELSMQQPPAYIEIDSINYLVDNFRLSSGEGDSAQFIALQGNISRKGKEDFSFEAGNLNIIQLAEMMDFEFNGSGLADISFKLTGTSDAPVIDGNFDVRDATVNNYKFTTLGGRMDYNNNLLNFNSQVVPQDSGRLEIKAEMPLSLNLDTMGFKFSPDDSLKAQILIEEFSLAVLNSFDVPVQTTGFIEGKVNVDGTANAPNPEGNIKLVDASFSMPEFGIDYSDVILNVNFLRDRIELDTLQIRTSDGKLSGNGLVNFGSDFYEGNISDSKIRLDFDKFNPVNHRQFNMQVDGYTNIKGEADSVVFSGDLALPQAEFYLPAIFSLMGRMDTKEMPKPILLQELESMSISLDSLEITQFETEEPDTSSFDYLNNLTGQIRLRIPRNTWIKNDDMRIEIAGELEVIKSADFFELFGQVEVVRGQYELLGRVFVINEGTVDFQGGEEMSFQMDIQASYSFRNTQQVQQELVVNITGTVEEPEINFELDGNAIEEGDALSYILFGKSMDELTINEQDNMERSGVGDLAQQAAASLISAQLTNFLQNKLDVDYIEVKSGGGFNDASVVVGKYIINKLFVSYEQRFGQTDVHNPKKYEVKLEYELFRFLFFELNNSTIDSGFDVIFKFDIL